MIDLDRLNAMAFARHIGMVFERTGNGESVVALQAGPEHANLQNRLHGGVVPAIVDAAGATAIWSKAPEGAVLTADLRVNFVGAGGLAERIEARARVVHIAGSSGYASVVVTNGGGEIIALGQVTGIIRKAPAG